MLTLFCDANSLDSRSLKFTRQSISNQLLYNLILAVWFGIRHLFIASLFFCFLFGLIFGRKCASAVPLCPLRSLLLFRFFFDFLDLLVD
jgi:hypothetical protein